MTTTPNSREQYSAHIPALHLLCNMGWHFLTTTQALELRGSTREVLLVPRLIEVLQTRRYEYKGQWYPLSPGGLNQIVRELSALSLAEGLLPANERLYHKLSLGITVTEFMRYVIPTATTTVDTRCWATVLALRVARTYSRAENSLIKRISLRFPRRLNMRSLLLAHRTSKK